MDAKDHLVNDVLRASRRYMVPLYQRQYQWGRPELQPFWDDIEAKADALIGGSARFPHYMGALILAPGGDGYTLATPRVQVVDGQQRLTTFQIFLTALREIARTNMADDVAEQISDYLINPKKAADTDPLAKFKLMPTPPDRELFHTLIETPRADLRKKFPEKFFQNGNLKSSGAPASLFAFEYFCDQINAYTRYGTSDGEENLEQIAAAGEGDITLIHSRIGALLEALLNHLKLVVITLDDGDDAQVIFETLNSKGKELQAMDLVRNNIFHRAEAEGSEVEALYEKLWRPFDDLWWREPAPRARPRLPRIDHFLAHVLTAQTGQSTSMRELYAEYRAYTRPKGKALFDKVSDELALLTAFAPAYEALEARRPGNPHIEWLGRKLAIWEMSSAYPIAFLSSDESVSDTDKIQIVRYIYAFIVRRALCGLSTKSVSVAFTRIAERLKRKAVTAQVFIEAIAELTRDATRFPNDFELKKSILENPIYRWVGSNRLQDILWELNCTAQSAFAEKTSQPENLSVEHILPQRWDEHWPMPDGTVARHDSGTTIAATRNGFLDTLGNLTLVTGGLNSSLGKSGFEAKKAKLDEHSYLALNKWICNRSIWSEEEILLRGSILADLAIKTWHVPSGTDDKTG